MVETAGNKLRRARQQRQLSLEDAARATKIRVNQLADLERDEYSNFANLAYARGFLVGYGKFLRVDVRPYLDAFAEASTFGLDDYQYLSEKPVAIYRVPHRRSGSRTIRPQRRQLIGALAGLAAMVMGVAVWILVVNVHRLGDIHQLEERYEAREKAAEGGTTATIATETTAPAQAPATSNQPAGNDGAPPAPAGVLPVAAPDQPVTNGVPAPTAAPATVPTQVSIPALANLNEPGANPVLPVDGDDRAVREMLTAHTSQPLPQKVANDRTRRQ